MTANSHKLSRKVILLLVISIAMIAAACSKTVVRENILSSIETGIGLFLAENKQTQMYELKAGYFRSQFYSIPTGKVVEAEYPTTFINMSSCRRIAITLQNGSKDEQSLAFQAMSSCRRVMLNNGAEQLSNAANVTPEVVSGIHANMGLQDIILGMKVSENFAVGKVAVMSPAAVAMYITMAKDPATAQAAASATDYASLDSSELVEDQQTLDGLLKKGLKANTTLDGKAFNQNQTRDYAKALAAKKGATLKTIRRKGGKDLEELIEQLRTTTIN